MKKFILLFLIFYYCNSSIYCQSNVWTWMSGNITGIQNGGSYGTKGVPNSNNFPGSRYDALNWKDKSGNLWLMGGNVGSNMNDIWKWDGTNWTWMGGTNLTDQGFIYGNANVPDPINSFGATTSNPSWVDSFGNFWVYGGSLQQNLWKWDGTNWTWYDNSTGPSSRYSSATGIDKNRNFWLFGGDAGGSNLNDLWKWDGTNWTNIKPNTSQGVFGKINISDPNNTPAAKVYSNGWIDKSGNFWVFGGAGLDAFNNWGQLNDLWKWDGTNWTWVSGSKIINQPGNYGNIGVASPSNVPGSRYGAINWTDASGILWLFGGYGLDSAGNTGKLNDLWKWDGTNWTWVNGSKYYNQSDNYGSKGVASITNMPGGYMWGNAWVDNSNNFWIFGGTGPTRSNALWKYIPLTNQVTGSRNIWTGSISTNWNIANNWSLTIVPSSTDTVVIPVTNNQPKIFNSTAAVVSQVILQTGVVLTVNGSLTVSDSIFVTPGATIINNGPVLGTVQLQQNIIGQRGFRMFSNPFTTAQSLTTLANTNGISIRNTIPASGYTDVRTFNNNTGLWSNVTDNTLPANTPYGLFIRGLASEVTGFNYTGGPTGFTYKASGTLNGNDVSITPLSASNFMLIGNPYAGPLNSQALTGQSSSPYYTYQILQGSTTALMRTMAGSWIPSSTNSNTSNTIPVLGVLAYMPTNTFSFDITPSDINTGGNLQTNLFGEEIPMSQLELQVLQNNVYQDKLFVRLDPTATANSTDHNDLQKFYNDNVNVYTKSSDQNNMAIDARNNLTTIPIGFSTNTIGNYTFSVPNNSLPDGISIYLKDNILNTETALAKGSNYNFSVSSDTITQGEKRFELIFNKTPMQSITQDSASSNTFSAEVLGNVINGNLVVLKVSGCTKQVSIKVTDIIGETLKTLNVENGIQFINIGDHASGMLFLQISDGKNTILQKIVKQ